MNFITGRAGSGKSRFCIEDIARICGEDPENKVFLIVPEQFTIQAERRMLEAIPAGGVLDNEVLSFKRLTHRVLDTYGGVNKKVLSISGRSMILARAFRLCGNQLSYYKNFTSTPWNVEKIMTLITEFIRYGVEPETIQQISAEMTESGVNDELSVKLSEISLVYKKYRELLNTDHMDELYMHKVLIEKLETEKPFKDAVIWIDEFTGFTTLELEIIESLVKQCRSVNICLLKDKKQKQLFGGVHFTMEQVRRIAENAGCPVREECLSDSELPRFRNNTALAALEREFGNYPCVPFDKEPENMEIFKCRDLHQEVFNSALLIRKLCSEKGLHFRNISVIVRDLENYKNIIGAIYPLMGISYFMDDKMSLDRHPLTSYVLDALDIIAGGWRFDSVFSFLKSGYFPADCDAVNRMENYVLARGIRGRSGWNKPMPEADCEDVRRRFMEHMDILYEGLRNCGNYGNALKALCTFIDGLEITAAPGSDKEENLKISGIISEVFRQLYDFLGGEKCSGITNSAEELKSLLKSGFSKYMVGAIPENTDCVQVGAADRSRTHEVEALIVLGANEGVFPANFKDDGLLSDTDREVLHKKGVVLSEDMRTRAFLEQFLLYRTISTPKTYLYVSYAMQIKNETARASWLVRRIQKILPKIKCTYCKEDVHFTSVQLHGAGPFVDGAYLSEDVALRLFTEKDGTVASVSSMEKYMGCPYRFFMEEGMKARPRAEFKIENFDTGSLLHGLLELGAKKILTGGEKKDFSEEECGRIIDSVTDEALAQLKNEAMISTARNRFVTGRLKKFATKALYAVARQCAGDAYVPGGFEVKFGYNTPDSLPPLEIKTADGNTVKVKGKIDRFDYWDYEGVRYFRIIDYKSYAENLTPAEVYDGHKMQLMTYMDAVNMAAVQKNIKAGCGGVFYFHISTSRTEQDRYKEKDKYKLKGLFYGKQENVEAMVGPEGGGGLVSQALKPETNPGGCTRVPEGGFDLLQSRVRENIGRITENIKKGKIDVKPIESGGFSPCSRCNCRSICGFSGNVLHCKTEEPEMLFNKYLKNKVD